MKYLKFMSLLLLACLGLASCDELTDDDREPRLTDYVDFKVNKCERIGSVLIVDFTAKNKTKETLRNITFKQIMFDNVLSSDDLGNKYETNISIRGGAYDYEKTFSLQKDESITGRFRITNFDLTNKAKKFELIFSAILESVDYRSYVRCSNIPITDNRVLANGFQTPDDNLEVAWVSSSRDKSKKEAYVTFTIKNISDESIYNLELRSFGSTDNTGSRCTSYGAKIGQGNYSYTPTCTIAAGKTVTYTLRIGDVNNSATAVSGTIMAESNSYTLCDNYIRYFDIPLQ